MRYYALLLLSGILMVIGCRNNQPSAKIADQVLPDSIFSTVVEISSATTITSADLKEFIDSAYCVPLETNTRSLIGDVNKLEILNDTLILFDDQNDLLLTFNKEGRFSRRIGRKGKGPQEYGRIGCFTADHSDNQMWIYDNSQQKILCYSLSGQLKYESPKIPMYPFYIARINGNSIFYRDNPDFNDKRVYYHVIAIEDSSLKITREYFPFSKEDQKKSWIMLPDPFYSCNGTLHVVRYWEGAVYEMQDSLMKPAVKIDFGKEAFPMEYTQSEEKFTAHKYQYSYLYLGSPVLESENFLYFRYMRKKKIYTGLYSKAEEKLYSLYKSSLKLKSSNLNAMLLDPVYVSEKNWFVSLVQPEMLLNIKKSGLALPPYLQYAVKNIQIGDNPVLLFFKLKDRIDK